MPGKRKKKSKPNLLSAGSGQPGLSEKEREARLALFRKFKPEVKDDKGDKKDRDSLAAAIARKTFKNAIQSGDTSTKKKKKKKKK
jgi:hypothetical protein